MKTSKKRVKFIENPTNDNKNVKRPIKERMTVITVRKMSHLKQVQ